VAQTAVWFFARLNETAAVSRRSLEIKDDSVVRVLDDVPDFLALHRHAPERYPFLLQSTEPDPVHGRFDILFACPGAELVLDRVGKLEFLKALDEQWRTAAISASNIELPFTGGWFLYLAYELAAEIEPDLQYRVDPNLPAAFAVRCKAALVRDRIAGHVFLVYEPDVASDVEKILEDVADCLLADCQLADYPNEKSTASQKMAGQLEANEETADGFIAAVSRAKEYIAAGDVYQANLSRSWSARADQVLAPDEIYESLSQSNPAPFAGLARWKDASIISSSPERLLRIRDGIISTRPIAGTRPRSDDEDTDASLSTELFSSAKEIAEHVMLIDLERNDLGRVCEAGTVDVDEMMVLESYKHVHHIVSNVRGELRNDVTPGEAIRAVFPGGTITGCPKVRCMEIIQELENGPRGAYTGSFGYLNRDGSLDLNILIRTMVARKNEISFRAGSGIVADSEPEAELAETRAKAKGMLRALGT
jgi:4-amino-4-deoxychorismate synthase (2-amino-4-deoxychorismate-forming) component I